MFKFVLIATIAIACVQAYNNPNDVHAQITKQVSEINEDGSYKQIFETSNGIAAQESGVGGQYATGAVSYYSPEGQLIQLQYVADDNGFQPTGSHLPTPPPIPAAILKSLEYIRTHPHYVEQPEQQQHAPAQRRAPVQHRQKQAPRPFGRHF